MKQRLKQAFLISCVIGGLTACAQQPKEGAPAEADEKVDEKDYTVAQLMQPRRFQVGDVFRLDNPDMTWRVVRVEDEQVYWESDTGAKQVTSFNPLLPALAWSSGRRGKGKRVISDMKEPFFPLEVGKSVQFKTTVNTDKPPYSWEFDWRCDIVGAMNLPVPAGRFDTFRIECSRKKPETWVFYYAPRIGYYVRMEATDASGGAPTKRELIGYKVIGAANGDLTEAGNDTTEMAAKSEAMDDMPVEQAEMEPATEADTPDEAMVKTETMEDSQKDETDMEKSDMAMAKTMPEKEEAASAETMMGPRFVLHLASYKNANNVDAGWQKIVKANRSVLEGMEPQRKRVEIAGKGTFTRLFAGSFRTKDEAEKLCRQLKNRGQYCAVRKQNP